VNPGVAHDDWMLNCSGTIDTYNPAAGCYNMSLPAPIAPENFIGDSLLLMS